MREGPCPMKLPLAQGMCTHTTPHHTTPCEACGPALSVISVHCPICHPRDGSHNCSTNACAPNGGTHHGASKARRRLDGQCSVAQTSVYVTAGRPRSVWGVDSDFLHYCSAHVMHDSSTVGQWCCDTASAASTPSARKGLAAQNPGVG